MKAAYFYGRLAAIVSEGVKDLPTLFPQLAAEDPAKIFVTLDRHPELYNKIAVQDALRKINGCLIDEFSHTQLEQYWIGYYSRMNDASGNGENIQRSKISTISQLSSYLKSLDDNSCDDFDWNIIYDICHTNEWLIIDQLDDDFICCDKLGNALMYDGERSRIVSSVDIYDRYVNRLTENQKQFINELI
jgi:hypothetical protein